MSDRKWIKVSEYAESAGLESSRAVLDVLPNERQAKYLQTMAPSPLLQVLIAFEMKQPVPAEIQQDFCNAMPSNLTKGTGSGLSAILFGDLREVMVGMFGDLEIVVDPHTKLNENLLRIASFMEVDLGLRHVESFSAMNDAITS